DVERCKHCPLKEGCYKEGAKSKSYSVKIKSDIHLEQMAFMETKEYQELMHERYKIEAKNAELKQNYGYGKASGGGLNSMKLQAAV
ncbi:transposase, partial [Allobaculum fili]|uniref:transposase n=1 Tax=Allobaculum fili TaxID=2834460 RepID=UPI001E2C1873